MRGDAAISEAERCQLLGRLRGVFEDARRGGFYPAVNWDESMILEAEPEEDVERTVYVEVDLVCRHGRSEHSWRVSVTATLAEVFEEGWGGDSCHVCSGTRVVCPNCSIPFPEYDEATCLQAFKNDQNLLFTTRCEDCGSAWPVWFGDGPQPDPMPTRYEPAQCGMWGFCEVAPPPAHRPPVLLQNPCGGVAGRLRNSPCPCGSGKKYKKCCGH